MMKIHMKIYGRMRFQISQQGSTRGLQQVLGLQRFRQNVRVRLPSERATFQDIQRISRIICEMRLQRLLIVVCHSTNPLTASRFLQAATSSAANREACLSTRYSPVSVHCRARVSSSNPIVGSLFFAQLSTVLKTPSRCTFWRVRAAAVRLLFFSVNNCSYAEIVIQKSRTKGSSRSS